MTNHSKEFIYIINLRPKKHRPAWLVEVCAWGMIALAVGLCIAAYHGWLDMPLLPVFRMIGALP